MKFACCNCRWEDGVLAEQDIDVVFCAHEQHAKERIEEWTKSGMHGRTLQRWIGYLEAVQSLRGEKK